MYKRQFVGSVLFIRLFFLQILSDQYEDLSLKNSVLKRYVYPERGYVFDRNGTLLVSNQPMYDLMVIPKNLKSFDTLDLCEMLRLTKSKLVESINKAQRYSLRAPSVLLNQISKQDYATLQEKMWKFPGMYIQRKSVRDYQTEVASNLLGYISEVNNFDIRNNPYYVKGELIGRQGIEKTYEKKLRGKKGIQFFQKDRFNRIIGPYDEGKFDIEPEAPENIILTIDALLQDYGESLMMNKRGGIVAIEPQSGEVLALVTAPSYDPNTLIGRDRSKYFNELVKDTIAKPLFDRSLQAEYSPGSPFKTLNALIGLQEKVISPETVFTCDKGHYYGRGAFMGCHNPIGTKSDLIKGIYSSCNSYFAKTFVRIINSQSTPAEGVDLWKKHLEKFLPYEAEVKILSLIHI